MSELNVLASSTATDWSKCCLCQKDREEVLKSPPSRYEVREDRDGYVMIARNVPLFKDINRLPIILDPRRLDEGDGIEETLRKNAAKYHQSCRLMFSNSKLERATKRVASSSTADVITEKSRRLSIENQVCFLCEKTEPSQELRQAMTMQLDKRLNECAKTLNDGKLLARLSGGDVVAQELKYHCSCLTTLYNRERAFLVKQSDQEGETDTDKEVFPQVFSELLVYLIETKTNAVFRLADLVSLYQQRLKQLGVEDYNVNSTRLKEKLLLEIPELEAYKKGWFGFGFSLQRQPKSFVSE